MHHSKFLSLSLSLSLSLCLSPPFSPKPNESQRDIVSHRACCFITYPRLDRAGRVSETSYLVKYKGYILGSDDDSFFDEGMPTFLEITMAEDRHIMHRRSS